MEVKALENSNKASKAVSVHRMRPSVVSVCCRPAFNLAFIRQSGVIARPNRPSKSTSCLAQTNAHVQTWESTIFYSRNNES